MPNKKSNKLKNIVINENNNNNKSLLNDDISSNIINNMDNITDEEDDINKINDEEDDKNKINDEEDNTNINNVVKINNTELVNENHKNSSNDFLKELLIYQIKNIDSNKKLNYGDIKRISKFVTSSIFNKDKCSIWNGYITNEVKNNKGTYINFYFKKKKIALHRLLYTNYIGELSNKEYIKFNCINKGKCCNINHMSKYSYKDYFGLNDSINNDKQGKIINITYQENDLSLII